VLSGAISAGLIGKMMAEEMASDELRELRNAMTQEVTCEHQIAPPLTSSSATNARKLYL